MISAAIEVHRNKGPGLLESIYEWCFTIELGLRNLSWQRQEMVTIEYKGRTREEPLRCDILVERCLIVEAKCVEEILPRHKAQLLSYMKLMDIPIGLLFNFHEVRLIDGLHRLILPRANQ